MRLSSAKVKEFADWSGDCNPLHVDADYAGRTFFGGLVAHGALCVLEAMRLAPFPGHPEELGVEFRHGVHPDDELSAETRDGVCRVFSDSGVSLTIRAEAAETRRTEREETDPGPETASDRRAPLRDVPRQWSVGDFAPDLAIEGRYPLKDVPQHFVEGSCLSPFQAQMLGLCSYIVGMEIPGRHSLFTSLNIRFFEKPEIAEVRYRIAVRRFVPSLRMLDLQLLVTDAEGRLVASADIGAYVPFSPHRVDVDSMATWLREHRRALEGRSALVCGGSRGLGADLVAALALCGCKVYVVSRKDSAELHDLEQDLAAYDAGFTLLTGDVANPAFCQKVRDRARADGNPLSYLILNACAPPPVLGLGPDTMQEQSNYVAQNLRLVHVPLATFAEDVNETGGAVVAVSSTYVKSAPRDFSHYVALKQAVEGFVRASAMQFENTGWLLPRPPKLQTTWNDTPTGVAGAVPSYCAALGVIDGLVEAPAAGQVRIIEDFPAQSDVQATARAAGKPSFPVAICGTFTLETVVEPLRFWFDQLGLPAEIETAGYGQTLQELVNPASLLGRNRNGANLILVRVRDWLRERGETESNPKETRPYLSSMVDELVRALVTHRQHAASPSVLLVCPSTREKISEYDDAVIAAQDDLVSRAEGIAGLNVVTAAEFESHYDVFAAQRYDRLRDEIAHIPFSDEYLDFLGAVAVRHLYRPYLPLRKVVAVDCDNTLWRGVVGEDGWNGIVFEPHHIALQEFLVDLSRRGILVCLCSKNVEPDVWEVFDKRSEMPLKKEHVVASMINWQPKSRNLRTLATRLNLGLDSFCFLDDNPVECAEVRAGCPEVLTLEWPRESGPARALLSHFWEFDFGEGTEEDRKRTQMYRDEYARTEVQAEAMSFDEFIANLELEIGVEEITAETLSRASQMTMRTNQFNFTTIRRSESEMRDLVESSDYECRILRVSDRFGDYGVVGLVILDVGGGEALLDTFLMSCRVLGRGVEQRMAVELGEIAKARGYEKVRLRIENTRKNLPARQFLQSICPEEFLEVSDEGMSCELGVGHLLAVVYDPAKDPLTRDEQDAGEPLAATLEAGHVRERESQVKRAAFELGTISDITRARGRSRAHRPDAPSAPIARGQTAGEVRATVLEAFADVLRRPAEEITEIDQLDELECDSLKIVTITVALSEAFPWLPSTLLFEHARVSAIVNAITALYRAEQEPVSASVPVSAEAQRSTPGLSTELAVVGIGVRCAGADSPEGLWRLLREGESAVRPVPTDREYFLGRLEDDRPHWAGLLDSPDRFDGDFFGAPPREAQWLDPQLRIFLEAAWSALEDAGHTDERLNRETGVFVGVMYDDYAGAANRLATRSGSQMRSWEGFSLANRLSQFMGFDGPSLAIETACSSSATALHQARAALLGGDCDTAVVGGVNLILDPNRLVQLGRLGILSKNGECRPFGDAANGTVMGEGAGVVVVKRLQDALDEGDRIYGVIKGTGVSAGAGSVGFTAPNPVAQAVAARRCIAAAGVDPRTISYVETHGTGTSLGDPIEVRGLAMAYEDRRLWDRELDVQMDCTVGSIKPNIGHLEAGAGVLGLIKVLLQLHHCERVPSITSPEPNPQIDFRNGAFSVQRYLEPWPIPETGDAGSESRSSPRRAAVNSFGVGGANAHIIVEEAPLATPGEATGSERPYHLILFSADRAGALAPQAQALRAYLDANPHIQLGDFAHTLALSKSHLEHRIAIVARDREQLLERLDGLGEGESRGIQKGRIRQKDSPEQIAFLFTGQGSQYAGMGRELYGAEPVYRDAVDECAVLFDPLLDVPLLDMLFAEAGSEQAELINQTRYTQPALFTLQYALARLWISWGVEPDIVVGHSIGEFAALCIAGGVSLEDSVRLVAERGRLMQALPAGGAMLAVSAEETAVAEAVEAYSAEVSIAALNAPGQVVISGAGPAVEEIAAQFEGRGVNVTRLTVSHAFHSPLMEPMLEEFRKVAGEASHARPHAAFLSTVDAGVREHVDADYWVNQIRKPVRFLPAMEVAAEMGVTDFIEIGPHPVLVGAGRRCIPKAPATWVASLRRDEDAVEALLAGLGQHVIAGGAVDWRAYDRPFARRRVPVPRYVFTRKSYWLDASAAEQADLGVHITALKGGTDQAAYALEWAKAPVPPRAERRRKERWAVVGDSDLAAAVTKALAELGDAVNVSTGGAAGQAGTALARALAGEERTHVVLVPAAGDTLEDADAGLLRFSDIARVMAAEPNGGRLWVVTRNAVGLDLDTASGCDLTQAALWGFARVFALESPSQWGGLIDVAADAEAAPSADSVVTELLADTDEDQTAWRDGTRLVPRLEPLVTPADGVMLSPDALYLVTGGTGALGRRCARWLALRGAKNLLLASRRGADAEGVAEFSAELGQIGVSVEIVAADVSRREDVGRLIQTASKDGRRLAGIIHAAGVDEQCAVETVDSEHLQRVFVSKALGAWWLHEKTSGLDLDFFALFSSMSAVLGSVNRGVYAAANAVLDALAHERRRLGLAATSVDWGPWAGGGMASADELESYARAGNRGLDPDAALKQFGSLLRAQVTQALVLDIDWARFAPVYEAKRARKLISGLAEAASRTEDGGEAAFEDMAAALQGASEDERSERIRENLIRRVREILELDASDEVDSESSFFDMGMDSLSVVEFATQLEADYKINDPAIIADHPTVASLTRRLAAHVGQLAAEEGQSSPPTAAPAETGEDDDTVSGKADRPPPDGITGYRPELDEAIDAFQREAWPERGEAAAEQWRWMFLQSAARLGKEPQMWLFRDNDRIVGETGAIPIELLAAGGRHQAAWLVDSMALEDYRSKAVGTRLVLRAMRDTPIALSLGQDQYMRRILLQAGWKQVTTLEHLVYPLRSEAVLRGRFGSPIAWVGGRGLDFSMRVRQRLGRPAGKDDSWVEPVERFGEKHDELWRRMEERVGCAGVRDASFLNWKYRDRLGDDFVALDIHDADRHVGSAVLVFLDPDSAYSYRRAVLLDLICPDTERSVVWTILDTIVEECRARDADAIHTQLSFKPLVAELLAFGFIRREGTRHLLAAVHQDQDNIISRAVIDGDHWWASAADSDMDGGLLRT